MEDTLGEDEQGIRIGKGIRDAENNIIVKAGQMTNCVLAS